MKWRRIIEHKFYTFCMNRWIFVFNQSLEYIGGSSFHAAIVTILSSATRQLHSPATIWNDEKARLCTLTTTANCILFLYICELQSYSCIFPNVKCPPPKILRPQNNFEQRRKNIRTSSNLAQFRSMLFSILPKKVKF